VAANVFHRAVAFAPSWGELPADGVEARLLVNGEVRDAGRCAGDIEEKIRAAAGILAEVDESLAPGDRIITGSVVQVPVVPGDRVEADLAELGRVSLQLLLP
jgi:2-keto-4-pentenoate hydratase